MKLYLGSTFGGLQHRHSGLDPESRISIWIPAFAGMTDLIPANIYATFRLIIMPKIKMHRPINEAIMKQKGFKSKCKISKVEVTEENGVTLKRKDCWGDFFEGDILAVELRACRED